MVDVNIKGVLYGIAAVLPHMQRQRRGHIINVSSVAGHKVGPGAPSTPRPIRGARAVAFATCRPEDVDINEILFRPTQQLW